MRRGFTCTRRPIAPFWASFCRTTLILSPACDCLLEDLELATLTSGMLCHVIVRTPTWKCKACGVQSRKSLQDVDFLLFLFDKKTPRRIQSESVCAPLGVYFRDHGVSCRCFVKENRRRNKQDIRVRKSRSSDPEVKPALC